MLLLRPTATKIVIQGLTNAAIETLNRCKKLLIMERVSSQVGLAELSLRFIPRHVFKIQGTIPKGEIDSSAPCSILRNKD